MTRPSQSLCKERDLKCKTTPASQDVSGAIANILDSGENGRIDGRTAAAKAMGYNPAAHKLGPKANQGVINEKLRALDRTNKPCRRWQKTGFKIRSFTGRSWELPTWRTPQQREFGEAAESRGSSSSETRNGNGKEGASSSNVGSDKSPAGENMGVTSSPIRIAPAPA